MNPRSKANPSSLGPNQTGYVNMVDYLDNFLKLFRRKQSIYFKAVDLYSHMSQSRVDIPLHLSYLAKDLNSVNVEENSLFRSLENIVYNRSLMYTLFIRIIQTLQQTKLRTKSKDVSVKIDQEKRSLADHYSTQLLNNTFHLLQMAYLAGGNATARIKRQFHHLKKASILREQKDDVVEIKQDSKSRSRSTREKIHANVGDPEARKLERQLQFRDKVRSTSTDIELTCKTIQILGKTHKPKEILQIKKKVKVHSDKVFSNLYKPLGIKVSEILQARKEDPKCRLDKLAQKNSRIDADINQYNREYKQKKKEFRIRTKVQ